MNPHEWRPGIPTDVSALIMALMTFQAINRGVDYSMGDRDTTTNSLTVVEQAMPLWMWGVLLLAGGIFVAGGMIFKRAVPVVWGSVILMATYAALAWGLVLRMIERGTEVHAFLDAAGRVDLAMMVHTWPWDGWRTPMSFLIVAVIWGLIGWGTRVMQRARGDGR